MSERPEEKDLLAPVAIWDYFRPKWIKSVENQKLEDVFNQTKNMNVLILDYTGLSLRFEKLFKKPFITVFVVDSRAEPVSHLFSTYNIVFYMTFEDQRLQFSVDAIQLICFSGSIRRGYIDPKSIKIVPSLFSRSE